MSTSVKATAPKADTPLIDNRFSVRRKMSSTALADVYWADDLYTPTQGEQDHFVLLVLAAPAISTLPGFAKAWSAVMSRPAPPAASYPTILDWGSEGDNYWFSCANTQGSLLSEYFNEIDKRGLTPDQAFNLTEAISHALSNVQAGAFGYFEPGSTLRTDHGYVLLNAPLVKVMHSLLLQQTGVRSPLALHSPWLSPSVAVGDIPVTEDDSFSMASLYQMLLGLQPPYGQQSTLTALARGTPLTANPKLKAEAQQVLTQALSLQRNQRPENPEALLKALGRKNYRKVLLPLAALAALGVVVYASYHLVSKFDDLLNKPTQITQTQTPAKPATTTSSTEAIVGKTDTTNPPTTEAVSLVNESAVKPVETAASTNTPTVPATPAEPINPAGTTTVAAPTPLATTEATTTATTTTNTIAPPTTATLPTETTSTQTIPSTTTTEVIATEPSTTSSQVASSEVTTQANPEQQAQLTQLILKATEAFNAGNTNGSDGALATLRQVWAVARQEPNARALLNKIIAQQQQQTESHINLNKPEAAKASLTQTDDLIREFTLTDRIEEQVRLESILEIREREQREAGDLLQQAKTAIQRGNLGKEAGESNALAYLNKLMFILPNNTEGQALLENVVQARQAQIKTSLERNKLSKAGDYLDETSRLIRKYNLTGLTKTQASLERDYRQAVEARQAQTVNSQAPNLAVTEQEAVDQSASIVPPPAEGERYVTPNDDLTVLNQAIPSTNESASQQPVVGELQNPESATVQTMTRPRRPQPAPVQASSEEIQGGPAQVEILEQPLPQEITQPAVEPAPTVATQPEELPVEVVLPEPQATPVAAGTINNQGVLNVRGLATPTAEEIPDSERK
ncbi:hypothetical protein [uncultured Thiothrix sp.]|uniref:hypothetical protein n=1 Tax=uncultured Thiothrix sp. TaxID=223185 RepID=UPI002620681A|nr:hypothetical protein [uncultured Thiothrix sp.]